MISFSDPENVPEQQHAYDSVTPMLTSPDKSALLLGVGHSNAYLAAPGFVAELVAELGDWLAVHDRLVIAEGPPRPVAWAQNIWLAPEEIAISSIGEAAKALRARQRNWALYAFQLHRRAALIANKLSTGRTKDRADVEALQRKRPTA